MSYEFPFKIKTSDLKFITCSCYYSTWKELKKLKTKVGNLKKLKMGENLLESFISIKKLLFIVVIAVSKKQLL